MERITLPYSLKNIPAATNMEYLKQLVGQLSTFQHNLTWRIFHYLNPDATKSEVKTFGFKSEYAPPFVEELAPFFDDLYDMVKNIEFRNMDNDFQSQLKKDSAKIQKLPDVIVESDKTGNLYKIEKKQYEKCLVENVTKEYKGCPEKDLDLVNKETCDIATELELASRMVEYPRRQCKMTIKDHKSTFPGKKSWRLINPAKSELGKVSKQILEPIIGTIRELTGYNLWRDNRTVIEWFKQFNEMDTTSMSFIQFDIEAYYPSISRELLEKAIKFARDYCDISDDEIEIILTSGKTFLFNKNKPHVKKNSDGTNFDTAMGAFDSCEKSELVGLYLLHQIKSIFTDNQDWCGLYRDDGLGVLKGSGPQVDKKRKQLCQIMKQNGLRVEALTNIKTVNFLDITFDLTTRSYRPYRKPNSNMVYLHVDSDHPPTVIRSVPKTVETRLSLLSSSEEIFNEEKRPYEDALKNSGHKIKLEYKPPGKSKRVRRRQITYFNPPYSKRVKTNIGRTFLHLIDKHFPKGTKLAKVMNRNCVKLSYSTTKNMKKIIDAHNRKVLEPTKDDQERLCNCRKPQECPLEGKCLTTSLVYEAKVTAGTSTKNYIGLTERTFKERFNQHQSDFRHEKNKFNTSLSKYVHELKEKGSDFSITWKIHTRAHTYTSGSRRCDLCLQEKLAICLADQTSTLNSRREMVSKCRHKRKHLLAVCTKGK